MAGRLTDCESFRGVISDWAFEKSHPSLRVRIARIRARLSRGSNFPSWTTLVPVLPASKWAGYFVYLPDGLLKSRHVFTLKELRRQGFAVAVVCATTNEEAVPKELFGSADALFWKSLDGFDFSAFSILVNSLANFSPNCDLFVMNDSVFGPFTDLNSSMNKSIWDFTGFTGLAWPENHIQSYAWFIRKLDANRADALSKILSLNYSYNEFRDVVYMQESKLASLASESMSVGCFWFSSSLEPKDLTVLNPVALLDRGFPFIKRSLFGKFDYLNSYPDLTDRLISSGHDFEML